MSRRSQAPKRTILPDPKYGSELLAKFMNMSMNDGKKSVAERIIYGALDRISDKETHGDERALELLEQALELAASPVFVVDESEILHVDPQDAVLLLLERVDVEIEGSRYGLVKGRRAGGPRIAAADSGRGRHHGATKAPP